MRKKFYTSDLIQRNLNFLRSIIDCSKSNKVLKNLLDKASDEQLLCFVEICFNLLKGRLPFHKNRITTLQKHANLLRKISRSRSAPSTRILLQKGNGIPPVAGLLASLIIPIITDKILK